MRRRTLLAAVGTAFVTGLAGCGGDSPDGSGGTDEPTAGAGTDTATPADTPASTDPATTASTDAPTSTDTPATTVTEAATDDVAQTVAVGPEFQLRFAPETFEVAAGGTVRWVWESGGHNVVAASTPEGSDWSGTPDAPDRTFDGGYTYEYTFEVAGSYEYYCNPHRGNGMTGSFTVVE